MSIAVFDSGLGGLTILREIRALLPGLAIDYLSDNAAFPYGPKPEGELVDRVTVVVDRLVQSLNPDLLVVACNTASTVVLPSLRERLTIPVVGVIPAIKPAAVLSRSKSIALLATPGTVSRRYTHELIEEHAAECEVLRVGSSELVRLAEDKLLGTPVDEAALWSLLAPFRTPAAAEVDVIVHGCTHFPLVEQELSASLGRDVEWVQSGPAIARRVAHLLELESSKGETAVPGRSFFTASPPESHALVKALRDHALSEPRLLP